jgi:hypothetical protein
MPGAQIALSSLKISGEIFTPNPLRAGFRSATSGKAS